MRILKRELDHGRVRLRIETDDDLWQLFNIIREGDTVLALTERKEDAPLDMVRAVKATRRKMVLGIRVENVEFHDFADRLRVTGIIEEGPRDLGSHHTLNLETGGDVTIRKDGGWSRSMRQRLNEAVEASRHPSLLILSMDDEEALLARLHHYGIREAARIRGPGSGKMFATKGGKDAYFLEVFDEVARSRADGDDSIPLVIVGPGFTKDDFARWCTGRKGGLGTHVLHGTGQSGMTAIYETMRSPAVERALEGSRVAREVAALERLMFNISVDGKATYGPREVREALTGGRVELLLVTDEELRTGDGEEFLELAAGMRTDHMVISTSHDPGKQLKNLGGYGAILRY